MTDFSKYYSEDYFTDRDTGSDPKRETSYKMEFDSISQFVTEGKVMDVGCGMGNFLELFGQDKFDRYGIEISEFAREKAASKGIKIIDFNYDSDYFDLIIWRGVFQHLDKPLANLQDCIRMLKTGGVLVFLATPNTDSIMFKLFSELPMLDAERNFVVPSAKMLNQILKNLGMEILKTEYPYLSSPYANPVKDHLKFFGRLFGIKSKFAFWKNMMEIYSRKI